ncbi:hypothetical protein V1283_003776 [Bradyrhizobium sp. AZCC 2262]|uniref:hypothetical protein n=1 Tax=Bradyrhizobium sp. AZCC 2262 TaxID=3117022 RepID=UPI002FEF6525
MVLTFRSSIPQSFTITGRDADGRTRTAIATREHGDFNWNMRLRHPSGRSWDATYHGEAVLDALGELITSKDTEYKQDKGRGDRLPQQPYDHNRQVGSVAPIIPIIRR